MHLHDSRALGLFSSPVYSTLRAADIALATELSYFVTLVRVSPQYRTVLENTISAGASCADQLEAAVEQKIGAWEMGGVFILFGAGGVLAIALACAQRLCGGARAATATAVPKSEGEGGLRAQLDEVLARLDTLGVGQGAQPGAAGQGIVDGPFQQAAMRSRKNIV